MPNGTTNTVTIYINSNTTAAVQGFQQFSTTVKQTAQTINETSSATSGMSSNLRNMIELFSIWKGYRLGREQINDIIHITAEFEKLDYALQRVVGSSTAATNMPWIDELGRASFGIAAVEKGFIQLQAVGIKPTQAQMEGLVGYLLMMGKTGEQELTRVTSRLAQFAQLGTIGFDQGLRMISQELPFAVDALAKKMNVNPIELFLKDAKAKTLDFHTLIDGILEYAAEKYKSNVNAMSQNWDVLMLRMKAGTESFRRDIGQSGFFGTVESWFGNLILEMDELQRRGTIKDWAKDISDSLSVMFETLGMRQVTVKNLGEKIVDLVKALSDLAPTLKGIIDGVKLLSSAMASILTVYGQMPSFLQEAAGYGIVGGFLFGKNVGLTVAAITAASGLLDKMGYYGKKDTKSDGLWDPSKADWSNTDSGLQSIVSPDHPIPADQVLKLGGLDVLHKMHLIYPLIGGGFAVAMTAGEAEGKKKAYAAWAGAQAAQADREAMQTYVDSLKAQTTRDNIGGNGASGENSSLPDGVLPYLADMTSNLNKMKTHVDSMIRASELAGKEGLDRDLAGIENKKREWKEDYDKAMAAATKAAEIMWGAGQYDRAKEIIENMQKQNDLFEAAMQKDINGKTAEWAKKNFEKYMKTLVDVRDIDQNVADIIKSINKYSSEANNLQAQLDVSLAKGTAAATMDAQLLDAKREFDNTMARIDEWPQHVQKMVKEVEDKLTKFGKHPSQEALDTYNWLIQYATGVNAAADKARQAAYGTWQNTSNNIVAIGNAEEVKRVQDLIVKYSELTEDTKGLSGARLELINMTANLASLQAKSSGEKDMIEQIRKVQEWTEKMHQAGDALSGFRYGMWDMARQSPTMWDTGIEMAKRMRQAFDDLGGAIADLFTKGTFDFRQFANSIINDLIRMMVQATITRPIFNFLSGFMGLSPTSATGAFSTSGTQLFGGNASLSGMPLAGVPRMHGGGVAQDEMLAILQEGERVVPKRMAANLGNTIATTIQVNITGQQGGGSGDGQKLGSEIATIVQAEFDKNLDRHLQPGGKLNRGMGY